MLRERVEMLEGLITPVDGGATVRKREESSGWEREAGSSQSGERIAAGGLGGGRGGLGWPGAVLGWRQARPCLG